MAIENTVSIESDPCSSIVDSVYDCLLLGVIPFFFMFEIRLQSFEKLMNIDN